MICEAESFQNNVFKSQPRHDVHPLTVFDFPYEQEKRLEGKANQPSDQAEEQIGNFQITARGPRGKFVKRRHTRTNFKHDYTSPKIILLGSIPQILTSEKGEITMNETQDTIRTESRKKEQAERLIELLKNTNDTGEIITAALEMGMNLERTIKSA